MQIKSPRFFQDRVWNFEEFMRTVDNLGQINYNINFFSFLDHIKKRRVLQIGQTFSCSLKRRNDLSIQ